LKKRTPLSTYSGIMVRPLRKDAAVRRSALLRAAAEVFAEEGIDTPLDRIAERAGVGRATLYRNFPGRTELALAVLMDDLTVLGAQFAAPVEPDAMLQFVVALSQRLRGNVALGDVVRAAPAPALLAPLREAMMRAVGPALSVSKAAGVVRSDLVAADIRIIGSMLTAGLQTALPEEQDAIADRALQLTLQGLRPDSAP
jgi:AcrR family transcriptional regulator